MTTSITVFVVLTSLTLIWYFFSKIRKFFEYMVKRQPDSENESKGKLKLQWLKNVWGMFALLFLGLNLLVILFLPGNYWVWVTNHLNTYVAVELGLIILISVFIATEGKKQGGVRLMAVLVILGIMFIGLGQVPEVAQSLEKAIPQAKANSTQVVPQPLQQYVIVAPPAPDWSQPLPSDVAAMIGSWRNMASRSDGDFRWKSNKSEGLLLDKELLRVYPGEWWHIRFQSATSEKNTIILTKRN